MATIPQIPPRPVRSQQQQQHSSIIADMDIPKIPPRPGHRAVERSRSPNRENFPRSPFNEPPGPPPVSNINRSGAVHNNSQNVSNPEMPNRPPSVALPSVGQEGSEYADINWSHGEDASKGENAHGEPQETRRVAGDLPLHAPKPSITSTNAKRRVSMVTRTDSTQADAAGLGKAPPQNTVADDHAPNERVLKPKVSFRTASTVSTERPSSAHFEEDEHGIPEIGQRVPMYPDAGDVQAPSPSPFQQQFPVGIGFHNSGSVKPGRQHRRTPSGRDILPPGSYGMHGHGIEAADKFEKDWYAKHPDALQREEHGEYGPGIGGGRGEWALSSDDLNKLVRETAKVAPQAPGLPNEQIGYQASEEYASRVNTPHTTSLRMSHSNSSQPHVESPLRKASFPSDPSGNHTIHSTKEMKSATRSHDSALESETEDESAHVSAREEQGGKFHGVGHDVHSNDMGSHGNDNVLDGVEDRGYSVPILASDEVAKTPGVEYMLPAIPPAQETRGGNFHSSTDGGVELHGGARIGSRPASAANSRPTSRHGSIHALPSLSRFSTHDEDRDTHTPLEDVEEYEPLFPDDEETKVPKRMTVADRLKLREQMKRFPSQDIWEDTPNSAQLQTTVETPEIATERSSPSKNTTATTFETAEQEAARKGEVSEAEKAKLIPREERLAKSQFKPHIQSEFGRPSIKQRFPSRDIWEDTPDSANLETTVGEASEMKSPQDLASEAGAIVTTSGNPKNGILAGEQSRDNATTGNAAMIPDQKPSVPARPSKGQLSSPTDDSTAKMLPPAVPSRPPKRLHQVPPADAHVPFGSSQLANEATREASMDTRKPMIPERSKPLVPARPNKPVTRDSSESIPLAKMDSASSVGSQEQGDNNVASTSIPKTKPAVPARPAGGKIANLKAGFLGDLESRLKLGPQGPKPQEKAEPISEEDKKPLEDARKGRAKGPAKRKPASSSLVATTAPRDIDTSAQGFRWEIQQPWTVWQFDEEEGVTLGVGVSKLPEAATPSSVQTAAETNPHGEPHTLSPAGSDTISESSGINQANLAVKEALQSKKNSGEEKLPTPSISEAAIAALHAEPSSITRASHASSLSDVNASSVEATAHGKNMEHDYASQADLVPGTEHAATAGGQEAPAEVRSDIKTVAE